MTEVTTDSRTGVALDVFEQLMWIDGARTDARTGEWREVKNPAVREQVIARVPSAGVDDVERAVAAARHAFQGWHSVHFTERARALAKIADDIEVRAEDFARLTALDTGNALRTQARPEVATLVALFRYFARGRDAIAPRRPSPIYSAAGVSRPFQGM